MPPIDWIHIAMFVAGLVLQYLTSRLGVPASPQPNTPSPTPATPESKPLLDLVHKLLDQRQSLTSPFNSQSLEALMGVVNKLLDQSKTTAKA